MRVRNIALELEHRHGHTTTINEEIAFFAERIFGKSTHEFAVESSDNTINILLVVLVAVQLILSLSFVLYRFV